MSGPEWHGFAALRAMSAAAGRDYDEESELYPRLIVCDARQFGAITVGRTRAPMWALIPDALHSGWEAAAADYDAEMTTGQAVNFLCDLLSHSREWGRLVLILADVSRRERWSRKAWDSVAGNRRRVGDQLRRCLADLEGDAA